MQKKELRKSWRRKLAGLLAGTLIAGVFGISTPMTAKAYDGEISLVAGTVASGEVTADGTVGFGDVPQAEVQSATPPTENLQLFLVEESSSKLIPKDSTQVTLTGYSTDGSNRKDFSTGNVAQMSSFDVKPASTTFDTAAGVELTITPIDTLTARQAEYKDTVYLHGTYKDTNNQDVQVVSNAIDITLTVIEDTTGLEARHNTHYAAGNIVDWDAAIDSTSVEMNFNVDTNGTDRAFVVGDKLVPADKKIVTVKNTGNGPVTLLKPSTAVFEVTYDNADPQTGSVIVPANRTVDVTIEPMTPLEAGTGEEEIFIEADGNNPRIKLKAVIVVEEQSTEITAYKDNQKNTVLDPSKDALNFNNIDVATGVAPVAPKDAKDADGFVIETSSTRPTAQEVYVFATGNQNIDEVTATLADPAGYERVTVQPYKITTAVDSFAKVTVRPKAGLAAGSYDTTLTISNGVSGEELVFNVKYNAVEPTMTLEASEKDDSVTPATYTPVSEIDFGSLNASLDGAKDFTLTVKNIGNTATSVTPGWKTAWPTATSPNKQVKMKALAPVNALAAGGETTFTVGLDTTSANVKAGEYSNTLVLKNGKNETVEIPVKFTVAESTYTFEVYDKAEGGTAITELDFGSGIAPQYLLPAVKTFYIKNTGTAKIYLSALETKKGAELIYQTEYNTTVTQQAPTSISNHALIERATTSLAPGKMAQITVGVNATKALSGTGAAADFTRTFVINTYKDDSASTTVEATKNITLKFALEKENISYSLSPTTLDYGELPSGFDPEADTEGKLLTITNNGNRDITFEASVTIGGTTNTQYDITNPDGTALTDTVLKVGESAKVLVTPKTKSLTGRDTTMNVDSTLTFSATANEITVPTNGTKVGTKTSTKVTKQAKAQYTLVQPAKSIKVLTETVAIPDLPEGYTQTEADAALTEIKVQNTGNVAIELASLSSGTFYTVEENPTEKIQAGETGVYKIKPRLGRAVDAYEAKDIAINLKPNDRNVTGKVTITMNVVARKTEAKVTPATLDFGTYNKMKAAPAAKTVTVENTGNGEITLTQPTATMFEIGDLDKTVIQGGEKATFTVVPKADIKAGEQKETITIKGSNGMTDLTVEATVNVIDEGWKKESDGWYYYKDGAAAKGWLKTGGKWYFLDKSTGLMKTGWLKDNGSWYYFKASGAMATNEWVKDGGKYYFFKSGGAMASAQWVSWKGDWYYMNSGGTMKTEGWVKSAGKWYYMGKDGKMVKSTSVTVKGKTYNFDKNGVCTNP